MSRAQQILTFLLVMMTSSFSGYSQGLNANFLYGYSVGLFDTNVVSEKAHMRFDSAGYVLTPANFKMPFRASQSTLSDESGNLQMATNGCWIADATGDTMQNGGGLLPNSFSYDWCDATTGIPYSHTSVFLPHPCGRCGSQNFAPRWCRANPDWRSGDQRSIVGARRVAP